MTLLYNQYLLHKKIEDPAFLHQMSLEHVTTHINFQIYWHTCICKQSHFLDTTTTTTEIPFPPECEYTGQTLANPLSCRKYYECLADGSWGEFNCCPNVFNPDLETCVTEEEGGELCGEDDEGCV